jgi:hypothetical protein
MITNPDDLQLRDEALQQRRAMSCHRLFEPRCPALSLAEPPESVADIILRHRQGERTSFTCPNLQCRMICSQRLHDLRGDDACQNALRRPGRTSRRKSDVHARLRGRWLWGHEAKQPRFKAQDGRTAFFIRRDQDVLPPFETLIDELIRRPLVTGRAEDGRSRELGRVPGTPDQDVGGPAH